MGISLGFHSVLTHRAIRVARPVELSIALCGCLAWQGNLIEWVATHRKHHSNPDRMGDPHSPHPGFWWGHLGWLILSANKSRDAAMARQ